MRQPRELLLGILLVVSSAGSVSGDMPNEESASAPAVEAVGEFRADSLEIDGASTIQTPNPTFFYSGEAPAVRLTASSATVDAPATPRGGGLTGLLTAPSKSGAAREILRPVRLTFDQVGWDFAMIVSGGPYRDYRASFEATDARIVPDSGQLHGTGTVTDVHVTGNFDLLVRSASITLHNSTDSLQVHSGSGGAGDHAEFQTLRFTKASLVLSDTRGLRWFEAERMLIDVDGSALMRRAIGQLETGGESARSNYRDILLEGVMRLDASARPDDGGLSLATSGSLTRITVGEEVAEVRNTVGAAGLTVLFVSALALLWNHGKIGMLLPLYARISNSEILSSAARRGVFEMVRANPGIDVKEMARGLRMGWSTAIYHLRVLERAGVVVTERSGRSRRIYENGGKLAAISHQGELDPEGRRAHVVRLRRAVSLMRTPNANHLGRLIGESPGLMQKELAEASRMPVATVSWLLAKLKATGLVLEERDWRAKRYSLTPLWSQLAFAGLEGLPATAGPHENAVASG